MYAGLKIDDRIKALREFPGKRRIMSSFTNQVLGGRPVGDTTPGGAASAWLLEDGTSGWLLEDGTSFWLLEG